jgi:DNA-binding transcriptional MerR regulator
VLFDSVVLQCYDLIVMTRVESLWTINELGAQLALALSVDYVGPASGRIRHIPDQRTIRYYTTLGLLDRPAEMRGRTALYGRRHLLQLVAIKRLQARGQSLTDIQQQLLSLGDAALRRLARLPEGVETPDGSAAASATSPAELREPFWTTAPASPSDREGRDLEGQASGRASSFPAILQGIPLDDDVTLLLGPVRPVEDDDLQAIRNVAAPLLKLLKTRRLLGLPNQEETS